MRLVSKLTAAAFVGLGFSAPAHALPMCPGGVYWQGDCLSVSDFVSGNFGAIVNGATGADTSTTVPPKPGVRFDIAADLAAITSLERDRAFLRARDAFDVKAMVAMLDRTNVSLNPGLPAMRQTCKPPVGNLVWGYTVVSINGVMHGTYGWVCQPMSRGINPK